MPEFAAHKTQFAFDVKSIIEMEEIPLGIGSQLGSHRNPLCAVSRWTMAKEGSKRIEIAGTEDKRQITAAGCICQYNCRRFSLPTNYLCGKNLKVSSYSNISKGMACDIYGKPLGQ